MIYTLNPSIGKNIQIRLLMILGFALLTGIGARVTIPREPVPITLQVLMVLLAGLTLGARDGFASQMTYIALIASGLPLASNGGAGIAALQTPSAGYIFSFPVAAGLVGLLAIRDHFVVRWLASVAGIIVIYIIGATYLKYDLNLSWRSAWSAGVAPFIVIDLAKAVIASGSSEVVRGWWNRQLMP